MTTQPDFRTALLTIRDASPPEAGLMAGVDTWSALVEELQKIAGDAVDAVGVRPGDGLLPCPCCKCTDARLMEEVPPGGEWKVRCEGCGLQTCWWHSEQEARDNWNTRATPQPARDAAEGAKEPSRGYMTAEQIAADKGIIRSAPPKPAPDAMRNALKPFADVVQFIVEAQRDTRPFIFGVDTVIAQHLTIGHLRNARTAYLSAPVPPADGALGRAWEALARLRAMTPTEFKAYHSCVDLFESALRALAPSGTGAAEPVAVAWRWRTVYGRDAHDDWILETTKPDFINPQLQEVEPLYATPPVRGDREAIIRLAEIHLGAWLKSSDAALQLIPTAARQDIRDFVDAILSLPAQPGAGERGWRSDLENAPKDGSRILLFAEGCLASGEGVVVGHWYKHPSTEGWITDAFDCGDYEFNPTHWKPLDAPTPSRQAPHSSSEGRR